MLAIAQAHNTFNYLNWIPSDSGPMITDYGDLVISDFDFSSTASINQVISNIRSKVHLDVPIFSFSLDASQVIFSSTPVPPEVNAQDMLTWHANQSQDLEFPKVLDSYHYPMGPDKQTYLNLFFPRKLRSSLLESIRQFRGEIRSLSVGIYSAENCARNCFHADRHPSYIVWRLGKYNTDQLLLIEDGHLMSYFTIRRSADTVKILECHGNRELAADMSHEIQQYLAGDLTGFKSADHIYVYQTDGKYTDVRKMIDAALDNVTLLNPLKVVKVDNGGKINLFKTSYLAETGMVFRGVDV